MPSMTTRRSLLQVAAAALLPAGLAGLAGCSGRGAAAAAGRVTLLNVSYDPTRELYVEFNAAFARYWKAKTGEVVRVDQSHGGSGKQARSVIDGLAADVVTLALAADIDAIASQGKLLPLNWQTLLPDNSSPYTSTIVFLVRKGNPQGHPRLGRSGEPRRLGHHAQSQDLRRRALELPGGLGLGAHAARHGEAGAREFVQRLYRNVPVLDTGARGATTTFVQRGLGDVLMAWENEAQLALRELGSEQLQIVVPSVSILAEPPVAVVDKVALRHGTRELARAYLGYLYSKEGQEIIARNFYRPRDPEVAARHAARFPQLQLVTIADFGGWASVQRVHFREGGIFDQIAPHQE